jgi:hypothetical protein
VIEFVDLDTCLCLPVTANRACGQDFRDIPLRIQQLHIISLTNEYMKFQLSTTSIRENRILATTFLNAGDNIFLNAGDNILLKVSLQLLNAGDNILLKVSSTA